MPTAFPYHIDSTGRTATAQTEAEHVRGLIEQVLFTVAGERVNRPTFGTGVQQLVFAPIGTELVAATQQLVMGALQQWLAPYIEVSQISVRAEDSTIEVTVRYRLRRTGESRVDVFPRESTL